MTKTDDELRLAGRTLLRGLFRARQVYLMRRSPEYCRDSVSRALGELVRAIGKVPRLKEKDIDAPLLEFMGALSDLDNGKIADFLKPKFDKTKGRPRDSTKVRQTKGLAAGALEALIKLGLDHRDGASNIAQVLRKYRIPIGNPKKESNPIDTIISWRENIRRNKSSNKAAGEIERGTYDDFLEVIGSTKGGKNLENQGKRVLNTLSDTLSVFYPKIKE